MSNEMNINEIVQELDRIEQLYNKHRSLSNAMDAIPNEQEKENHSFALEIIETLHKFREKQDEKFTVKKPAFAKDCLTSPPMPPENPKLKNPAKDILVAALSGLILLGLFVLFVIGCIPSESVFITILSSVVPLPLLIVTAYWIISGSRKITMVVDWQKAQKKWEKEQAEWEASFSRSATKEKNERFLNNFKEYDACFLKLVEVCSEKYGEELDRYGAGLDAIKEKHLKKLEDIGNKDQAVCAELDEVTLIHSDLFANAWRISSMLRTDRAETLKEAINMALDEERKEKEEAERKAEARRQEAILEKQAQDNLMHNRAMERAAEEEARATRAHNAAMERAAQEQARAAEAQAREAARQSEFAQKQARDAQRAASARCAGCANNMKCSYTAKQNAGSCGAYRPR